MLQVICIIVLYLIVAILASRIGRLSGKKWSLGFFLGLSILLTINLPRFIPGLINYKFYQTVSSNSIDLILIGIAGIIAIIPCIPRLSRANTRYLVTGFLVITLIRSSLLPATCSFLNKNELNSLSSYIDEDGVYLQSTGYTCGPAALATVLNAYGIKDTEGNIALSTGCNSYSGTRSIDLVNYINSRYPDKLTAKYLHLEDIQRLMEMDGYFIAEVKASTFTDHFVAIMRINDGTLTIADPAYGKFEAQIKGFSQEWRHKVIVVQRTSS